MSGNEFLKQKRIESHLSIRGLAMSCDIAPRMVSSYEKGEKSISSMPVYKALRYFSAIRCDIEPFFFSFYPFKRELDELISSWAAQNPRCYDVSSLKKRYYHRLAKIRERERISKEKLEDLVVAYNDVFNKSLKGKALLSKDEYQQYILSLNTMFRKASFVPSVNNLIVSNIKKEIYSTEYSIKDISFFCDITNEHLLRCLDNDTNLEKLHIISALKLCYVLGVSFADIFAEVR